MLPGKMKRLETRPYKSVKKNPAAFIESILGAYDPEKSFELKNIPNPVVAFFNRLTRKPTRNATEQERKAIAHDQAQLVERARILEVNRLGVTRVRVLNNGLEFREALQESKSKRQVLERIVESGVKFTSERRLGQARISELRKLTESEKFREDWGISDQNDNTYDEYIPIMGGPWSHQQYLHDFLDGQAKAFESFNHNPYAHFICGITTCFVLGRGVTFKANDSGVHEKFKKWWDDNDMDDRIETWSDMLTRDGELIIRKFRNPSTGEFFLRWISPSTIWEFVSDIEDTENIFYAHQQFAAAYQVLYGSPSGSKFNPSQFESSKYIINQIPFDELYVIKINVGPDEKRGRSDLFNILSWLKRHKDHQTGVTLKAIVQSVFAWKNKLSGMDTDVNAYIAQFGTDIPDFGSVHVENEASDLQPMTADSKTGGVIQDAPSLIAAIAVGAGLSTEYFGGTGGGKGGGSNRAAAIVGTEPSTKKFQRRQLLLGRLLKRIAADWADNEKFPTGIDTDIDFQFPEIAIEDRTAKIKDLQTTLQDEVYDHKTYSVAVAKEMGNHDYNYEETQAAIDADKESGHGVADIYGMGLSPAPGPGAALGQPQPAGHPAQSTPTIQPQPKAAGGLSGAERKSIKTNDRR